MFVTGAQLHHIEEFKDVVTVEDLDGVCQGKEGIQRIEFEDRLPPKTPINTHVPKWCAYQPHTAHEPIVTATCISNR